MQQKQNVIENIRLNQEQTDLVIQALMGERRAYVDLVNKLTFNTNADQEREMYAQKAKKYDGLIQYFQMKKEGD